MIRPIATEIGLFLIPFVLYAVFLLATRAGRAAAEGVDAARVAGLVIVSLVLMVASFVVPGAILRRAAGLDLCAGAYRGRQVCAGNDAVMPTRRSA